MRPQEIRVALEASELAFRGGRQTPCAARARPLRVAARLLRRDAGAHGARIAREMGKPVREGRGACDGFGLGAAVFTRDLERGERIARSQSRRGRRYGKREFVNVKSVRLD